MRWQSFFLPCLLLGNWYTKWKCSWNTRTHDEIKPKQNKTRDINFDYFIGIIERVNRSIPSILMRFDLICLCGGKTCLNDLNVIGEVHCTYFLFPSKWAHAYNTHYTCSLTAFYSTIFRIAQIFITHLKNGEKLPKWTLPRSISRLRNDIATQRMTMTQKLLYENCVLHIYSFWRGWSRWHRKENVRSCCCCRYALCQWWVKAHRWKSMQTMAHKDSNSNSNFNLILLTLPYTRYICRDFAVVRVCALVSCCYIT